MDDRFRRHFGLLAIGRPLAAGAAVAALALGLLGPSAASSPETIVSLTFDDGRATAYAARAILAAHGAHATFYVNSPRLGSSSFYMTWPEIAALAGDGNEIGGHTAYHVDSATTDSAELARQICYDRDELLDHGLRPTSFAYPFGAYDARSESIAEACGYDSARTTDQPFGGVETIPPADPYAITMTAGSSSLTALEKAVRRAETSGGWVILVFHDVCNECSHESIRAADFEALLTWLDTQGPRGVLIRTIQEVVGGPLRPPVAGPALPGPWSVAEGVHNPSLETDADGDGIPDCWQLDGYGENVARWGRTREAHTGQYAESLEVTGYRTGDEKLMVAEDLGACTPTVLVGHRYRISAWYRSTAPTFFTVFVRHGDWSFPYWVVGPSFPPAADWTRATWVTPPVSADVNGLAFGLTLTSDGRLAIDDVSLEDASGEGS